MKADIAYRPYFQRLQDIKSLLIHARDVSWIEKYSPPERGYAAALYLGCNILRTPHIAQQVMDILSEAELDFVAMGGVQFCCGIIWDANGDMSAGQAVSRRTVEKLSSYTDERVILWCPSCSVHFESKVTGRDSLELPFEVETAVRAIRELLDEGVLKPHEISPRRVVLHNHEGREGDEVGRRRAAENAEEAMAILRHLPGVEIVGEIKAPAEFEYDCGPAKMVLPEARFVGVRDSLIQSASEMGADVIVTISHACHREWCGYTGDGPTVVNYVSLVAEAIGIPVRDDLLDKLRRGRSVDEIVLMTRPNWESHGKSVEEARQLVEQYFAEVGSSS